MIKNWLVSLGFVASAVLGVGSAEAATFSFDLSADMSTVDIHDRIDPIQNRPFQSQWLELTNTATGLKEIAPFTLNVGDTVNVTVSLNAPMTIPVSHWLYFTAALLDTPTINDSISMDESTAFFSGGAPVSIPGLFEFDASTGFLALGPGTNVNGLASFQIDKITFSGLVTAIIDDPTGQDIGPLGLLSRTPMLFVDYGFQSATTPIPGAALLMLTGLGGLAGAAKLRRKLTTRMGA
jgi:hypothetical protein